MALKIEVAATGKPICEIQPARVLAGHDARPCGGTDMAGRIGVGEFHPLLGQAIDVGRVVKRTPEAADIPPAHVIHQKKYHVGPLGRVGRQKAKRTAQHHQEMSFHGDGSLPKPQPSGNAWLNCRPVMN